jgi:pimeloyl-ACP methyl ester carboxylesterase
MLPAVERPIDPPTAPPPDPTAEPSGYVVLLGDRDRIHFLDWGGPGDAEPADGGPGVLLIHGLGATSRSWTPVARRLRAVRRVVAMDLRGHGLSDAPTDGYEPATLADDAVAVAEGAGVLAMALGGEATSGDPEGRVVLAGHGYGAIVAAWTAAALGERCAGLVLIDGGWEDLRDATGLEPDEFLRGLDEPPEVLASMSAFLADRAAFDPATWDADQEAAARETVVELPVGRLAPAIHDHVRTASIGAMFGYDPVATLRAVSAPVTMLVAADDVDGTHARTLASTLAALSAPAAPAASAAPSAQATGRPAPRVVRFPQHGHALMRYRPAEVTAAILAAHRSLPTTTADPEEPA